MEVYTLKSDRRPYHLSDGKTSQDCRRTPKLKKAALTTNGNTDSTKRQQWNTTHHTLQHRETVQRIPHQIVCLSNNSPAPSWQPRWRRSPPIGSTTHGSWISRKIEHPDLMASSAKRSRVSETIIEQSGITVHRTPPKRSGPHAVETVLYDYNLWKRRQRFEESSTDYAAPNDIQSSAP